MRKHLRDVKKLAKQAGFDVVSVDVGKHIKLTLATPSFGRGRVTGQSVFKISTANTPSCQKSLSNFKSDLARLKNETSFQN